MRDPERDPAAGRDGAPGPALDPGTRSLVSLSAALAGRNDGALDAALEEALAEAAPEAVEEALVQSYLFLGYPAALNALARWRELSGRRPPAPTSEERGEWRRRGVEVCRKVYGDQYEALRRNIRDLHPDMEGWMLEEGYGKVLGRAGLELRVRELCIAALLAVLDTPVQLYSHLRGALNAGADPGEVDEALEAAAGYMDDGARRTAEATWRRVRERAGLEG